MKLFIRTDASIQIGSGHVMRCLTLADRLRERGAEVRFVCRELLGHLGQVLADKEYPVYWLPAPAPDAEPVPAHTAHSAWLGVPWEVDAEQTRAVLAMMPEMEWLIVDHYALDRAWESWMRPLVKRIMVIDDLADRPHDCDLLLDQNLYEDMEHRYDGLTPVHCQLLLGPRYALLRPEFLEARKHLRQRDGVVRRILVFFGGTDPSNETAKALRAIQLLNRAEVAVDVVVGVANPHKVEIVRLCEEFPNASFHCQVSNMAELMAQADLAIGSGGTATWERFCLALPSIVISVAQNQIVSVETLARAGRIFYFGWHKDADTSLAEIIRILCSNQYFLLFLSNSGRELVDGKGAYRVCNKIVPFEIRLRLTDFQDCDNLFMWRNAEETRKYFFDPNPIRYEDHCAWLRRTIVDPNKLLLIGEFNELPIGVLRYDISESTAIVSIYLVPGKHSQGYGAPLLEGNRSDPPP